MSTGRAILRFAFVFLVGVGCAVGWDELTRQEPPEPAPDPVKSPPPPDDPVEAAKWVGKERPRLSESLLYALGSTSTLAPEDREKLVRALGKVGTPEAIHYLIANHQYTIPPGESGPARMPCLEALREIGVAAVPSMVEAYITWPESKDPLRLMRDGFGTTEEMAGVAYVYAQGFLFANHDNAHYRVAVVRLVNELRTKVTRDLPYPPPWFTPADIQKP